MPQAIALALPRQVRIYVKDDAEAQRWHWADEVQKALGLKALQLRTVKEEK